mmetsp:Transcript_226/g.450  ORF Transcript_226/g.450 Transcript_226/m.450 type:complete len:389 (+) Transcript_226:92-1258(+)
MAGERQAGGVYTCGLCVFFLVCGTWNSVSAKLLFHTYGDTPDGGRQLFKKPWFQVWAMFLGMFLTSIPIMVGRLRKKLQNLEPSPLAVGEKMPSVICKIAVPAGCDLIATFLQNVALVFINASIWQMLRGSIIIFVALIRYLYLKKKTKLYEMAGIAMIFFGLLIVGSSSLVTPTVGSGPETSTATKLIGVFLMFLAQLTQALQSVVEEKILCNISADPTFVVAVEGFWGLVLVTAIFMPLAQTLPGEDGTGIHENVFPEDFYMWSHNAQIFRISLLFIVVVMVYNVTGMMITQVTHATTRNVVDGCRTFCVWATMVILHFFSDDYGEPLGWWSLIQAAGFLLLVLGMFVYNKILQLPCAALYVPDAQDVRTVSDGRQDGNLELIGEK